MTMTRLDACPQCGRGTDGVWRATQTCQSCRLEWSAERGDRCFRCSGVPKTWSSPPGPWSWRWRDIPRAFYLCERGDAAWLRPEATLDCPACGEPWPGQEIETEVCVESRYAPGSVTTRGRCGACGCTWLRDGRRAVIRHEGLSLDRLRRLSAEQMERSAFEALMSLEWSPPPGVPGWEWEVRVPEIARIKALRSVRQWIVRAGRRSARLVLAGARVAWRWSAQAARWTWRHAVEMASAVPDVATQAWQILRACVR